MNILFPKIQISRPVTAADKSRNNNYTLSFGQGEDIFLPSKRFENSRRVEKLLNSVKKVTPNEYKKLSDEQLKDFFYYNLDDNLQIAVEDNLAVALPLKDFLDRKYGKDKYIFVSIGSSPSPIGRIFEFSGVETKYLPISDLMYADKYHDIVKSAGFEDYEKFLKEQGISKKNLERHKKTFVFYDYTSSGHSLSLFKDLMMYHLNLPEDKVDFRSLNEDLYYCCAKKEKPLNRFDEESSNKDFADDYIMQYLADSHAEYFGGIRHLSCRMLSNIAECKIYSNDTSKIYNLYVMHRLEEMGILKNNPKNRKSL